MKKIILTILCLLSLSINAYGINTGGCYPIQEIIPNVSMGHGGYCENWAPDCRHLLHNTGYKIDPDVIIRDRTWYPDEDIKKYPTY